MKPLLFFIISVFWMHYTFSQENKFSNPQRDSSQFVLIEDTLGAFESVEDILKLPYFQNKVVYVDIWGTRCAPCFEEFEYIADLKKRFRDKEIVFLYLCTHNNLNENNRPLWKKMIKKYELSGINIFITIDCYSKGFWKKHEKYYSADRQFGIPTFLIVNKKGQIVNFDAERPSAKEKLYSQIDEALESE